MEYLKYQFNYSELDLKVGEITKLMGYEGEAPQEITDAFRAEADRFMALEEIHGGLAIRPCTIDVENDTIIVTDNRFYVGRKICRAFRNSEQIAVFVCTAGQTISDRSKELMAAGDLLEGYTVDVMGSVIVERAMDLIQEKIKEKLLEDGLKLTNRYSPGYCEWNVSDQRKVFSLFPDNCCDVRLTDSSLMLPIKSVSGFIGVGSDVVFHAYTCDECSNIKCIYRNKK